MKRIDAPFNIARYADRKFGGDLDKAIAYLISEERAKERAKTYQPGGKNAHIEGNV